MLVIVVPVLSGLPAYVTATCKFSYRRGIGDARAASPCCNMFTLKGAALERKCSFTLKIVDFAFFLLYFCPTTMVFACMVSFRGDMKMFSPFLCPKATCPLPRHPSVLSPCSSLDSAGKTLLRERPISSWPNGNFCVLHRWAVLCGVGYRAARRTRDYPGSRNYHQCRSEWYAKE